jgi:hypothetical protein
MTETGEIMINGSSSAATEQLEELYSQEYTDSDDTPQDKLLDLFWVAYFSEDQRNG